MPTVCMMSRFRFCERSLADFTLSFMIQMGSAANTG